MRNNEMPQKLIDLERELRTRGKDTSVALRAEVMRAVEDELNQSPRGRPAGWNWAAAGVAILILLNLSAVWRMGNPPSSDSAAARRWVMTHRKWHANQETALNFRHRPAVSGKRY